MANLLRTPNLIICCFVGFILNVATVAMFVLRRNSRMKQQMPKGKDVKLFGKLVSGKTEDYQDDVRVFPKRPGLGGRPGAELSSQCCER